jgi:hypothetical protein
VSQTFQGDARGVGWLGCGVLIRLAAYFGVLLRSSMCSCHVKQPCHEGMQGLSCEPTCSTGKYLTSPNDTCLTYWNHSLSAIGRAYLQQASLHIKLARSLISVYILLVFVSCMRAGMLPMQPSHLGKRCLLVARIPIPV